MLKLYYLPGACPIVPHVALEWAKAQYEAQAVGHDTLKSPQFLALNPQGSVPVLQDGDWVLTQNMAILDYIDEIYPQARLFGSGDAKARAKVRQWLAFANTDIHKEFGFLFNPGQLIEGEGEEAQIRTRAGIKIEKMLAQADKVLSGQNYLTGELTIADVYFFVLLMWAKHVGLDLGKLEALEVFYQRVRSNEGVQNVLKQQGLA